MTEEAPESSPSAGWKEVAEAMEVDPDPRELSDEQKAAIETVLTSDEVPEDVKQIALDEAERYGFQPSVEGVSS